MERVVTDNMGFRSIEKFNENLDLIVKEYNGFHVYDEENNVYFRKTGDVKQHFHNRKLIKLQVNGKEKFIQIRS